MKMKLEITLHAPSKKALEQFREFVAGTIKNYHDSGEAPIGVYFSEGEPEQDKED